MTFIITLLKRALMLNYCLLTQTVLLMKDFLSRKICLTLVIIQKIIQKFFDQTNKNVIGIR